MSMRNSGKDFVNPRFPECEVPCFACDRRKTHDNCGLYRSRWEKLIRAACIPLTFRNAEQLLFQPPKGHEHNYRAVLAYVESIEEHVAAGRGLLLQGDVGTSKTTLACAVGLIYLKITSERFLTDPFLDGSAPVRTTVLYLSALEISNLLFRLRADERDAFEVELESKPLLIFDDLGYEKIYDGDFHRSGDFVTTFVQGLVERRHKHCRASIFTTNLTNTELKQIYNKGTIQRISERNHPVIFRGESLREPFRLPGFDPPLREY